MRTSLFNASYRCEKAARIGARGLIAAIQNWAQWRLCFLLFLPLPLPFFLPLPLPDLPPPIAALQAELILALFLNRQDATLARSGINSLQMLCASPAHGCCPPPCPDFMSSARCAPAGEAHNATQNAAATSFHLLMRIVPSCSGHVVLRRGALVAQSRRDKTSPNRRFRPI